MSRFREFIRVSIAALCVMVLATWCAGAASAAPSEQDSSWMVAAHQSNLSEIAAGQAAQQKAVSPAVRSLGAMLIADHVKLDADLTAAAAELGVGVPSSPSAAQQASLASVSAKSGAAFDSAWVTAQLGGHRASVAATRAETTSGSDATALKLARTALPVIEQHLSQLQTLAGSPSAVQAGSGGQAAVSTPASIPVASLWVAVFAALGVIALASGIAVLARRRNS